MAPPARSDESTRVGCVRRVIGVLRHLRPLARRRATPQQLTFSTFVRRVFTSTLVLAASWILFATGPALATNAFVVAPRKVSFRLSGKAASFGATSATRQIDHGARPSLTTRNFLNFEMPDISGEKKKAAAARVVEAEKALEEARLSALLGDSGDSGERASSEFYVITTESDDGIAIRETPELKGARTGEDLRKGTMFEVDEVLEREGQPTFLRLASGRGWVFDTSPIDPEKPSVRKATAEEVGFTVDADVAEAPEDAVARLELEVEEARRAYAAARGARYIKADEETDDD